MKLDFEHLYNHLPRYLCIALSAILLLPLLVLLILILIYKCTTLLSYMKIDTYNQQDFIQRAEWLRRRVIVDPEQLMSAMPAAVGRHFQGEWAIYSLAMTTSSLTNISRLYPEYQETYRQDIKRMISITTSSTIQQYDAAQWGEYPLASLDGDKSHMTYLSLLAWMITNYKLIGGDDEYDYLLHSICETLNRRMLAAPDLNLESFPDAPIFIPDMLVTIVALHHYSRLYDGQYADIVACWMSKAKTEWIDQKSGLLAATITSQNHTGQYHVCSSYAGLTCYYLSFIDEDFARQQYDAMKRYFGREGLITGIREQSGEVPLLDFHIDAGPLLLGYSPSGTAFAIGCATYFEDWAFRNRLLRTAELAATTIYGRGERHYLLASYVPVGEAITLAMKTHFRPR